MKYINQSAIKKFYNNLDRQITKDGLEAIDRKIEDILFRSMKIFNGHKKRMGADIINMVK